MVTDKEESKSKIYHVIHFGWDTHHLQPYLLLHDGMRFEKKFLKEDETIAWKTLPGKYCIGYKADFEELVYCGKMISDKWIQCFNCKSKEFYACRITCKGKTCNPSSKLAFEICDEKKTWLYFTWVGGKYKVGVSTDPLRRWLEQGSDLAVLLGRGKGLITRQWEDFLGKMEGITKQVNFKSKKKTLTIVSPDKKINDFLEKKKRLLSQLKNSKDFEILPDEEVVNLHDYYLGISHLSSNKFEISEEKLISDEVTITGKIRTVKGFIMILDWKGKLIPVNMKKIIGRKYVVIKDEKILLDAVPSNNTSKQTTLLDF